MTKNAEEFQGLGDSTHHIDGREALGCTQEISGWSLADDDDHHHSRHICEGPTWTIYIECDEKSHNTMDVHIEEPSSHITRTWCPERNAFLPRSFKPWGHKKKDTEDACAMYNSTEGKTVLKEIRADAIYGIIHMYTQYFLILASESQPIGSIRNHVIRSVKKFSMLHLPKFKQRESKASGTSAAEKINDLPSIPSMHNAQKMQTDVVKIYRDRISSFLSLHAQHFYFSLSHTLSDRFDGRACGWDPLGLCWNGFMWEEDTLHSSCHYFPPCSDQIAEPRRETPRTVTRDEGRVQWVTPMIWGYVGFKTLTVERVAAQALLKVQVALISRRSRFRAGVRYTMRGIDSLGNAANMVETEQVMEMLSSGAPSDAARTHAPAQWARSTFCIYRGSLPTFWQQYITGAYKPPAHVLSERDGVSSVEALRSHFGKLHAHAKGWNPFTTDSCQNSEVLPCICVNLLSPRNIPAVQTAVRKSLYVVREQEECFVPHSVDFEKNSAKNDSDCDTTEGEASSHSALVVNTSGRLLPLPYPIHWIDFDFHAHIRGLWDYKSLESILERLSCTISHETLSRMYNMEGTEGQDERQQQQTGIIRVNCVDCTDRTNLVQSIIAVDWVGRDMFQSLFATCTRTLSHPSEDKVVHHHQQFVDRLYRENIHEPLCQLWADTGEILGMQYTGTGAHMYEVTAFRCRTFRGIIRDGVNGLRRYFRNNFMDGEKQDSISLLSGTCKLNGVEAQTLIHRGNPLLQKVLISILLVSSLMMFLNGWSLLSSVTSMYQWQSEESVRATRACRTFLASTYPHLDLKPAHASHSENRFQFNDSWAGEDAESSFLSMLHANPYLSNFTANSEKDCGENEFSVHTSCFTLGWSIITALVGYLTWTLRERFLSYPQLQTLWSQIEQERNSL